MPTWPADKTAMEDAIHGWVQTVLQAINPSWTAIWADQDHPRPDRPFAVLRFVDAPQEEAPSSETITVPVYPTAQNDVRAPASMVLEVQMYAADDQEAARVALRQSIVAEWPHREALRAAGVAVGEIVSDQDLTQVVATKHEYRGLFEVRLRVAVQHTVNDYPWVETVEPATIGVF